MNDSGFSHDIPEHAVRKIFKQYDVNNDGYINFDEFLNLLESDIGRHLLSRTLNTYIRNTVVPRGPRIVRAHVDFTDGGYEDEYTCIPPPLFMLLISTFEVIISLLF